MLRFLTLGICLLALVGCRNPCQQVCLDMADLFDTCGVEYDASEVQACLKDYRQPDEPTLAVCEETQGELEVLLEQKSPEGDVCEEISQYGMP